MSDLINDASGRKESTGHVDRPHNHGADPESFQVNS